MENMNENVGVMNNEVDAAAADMESTKPSAKSVIGGLAFVGLAGYGLFKLGQKVTGFFKNKREAKMAAKAAKTKGDAVETTATDVTDAE